MPQHSDTKEKDRKHKRPRDEEKKRRREGSEEGELVSGADPHHAEKEEGEMDE
jgi:hypothetical protein